MLGLLLTQFNIDPSIITHVIWLKSCTALFGPVINFGIVLWYLVNSESFYIFFDIFATEVFELILLGCYV